MERSRSLRTGIIPWTALLGKINVSDAGMRGKTPSFVHGVWLNEYWLCIWGWRMTLDEHLLVFVYPETVRYLGLLFFFSVPFRRDDKSSKAPLPRHCFSVDHTILILQILFSISKQSLALIIYYSLTLFIHLPTITIGPILNMSVSVTLETPAAGKYEQPTGLSVSPQSIISSPQSLLPLLTSADPALSSAFTPHLIRRYLAAPTRPHKC